MDAGIVCSLAGLAPTLPLQSRTGLQVHIACKGQRSTALALQRDGKPHPTRCEVGRNPKARSLARIQIIVIVGRVAQLAEQCPFKKRVNVDSES
jgi:hypothetical protein